MPRQTRSLSIQQALEWAFRDECASLDLPDTRPAEERGFGFGMEYVLIQRARLGTNIDKSRGRNDPHEDAEVIAASLANLPSDLGGKRAAIQVAELSRSSMTPDWMPDAKPRIIPREWARKHGKTERCGVWIETVREPHPTNPARTIKTQKRHEIRWTPCTWDPSQQQIEAARRGYKTWWQALHETRAALLEGGMLREIKLTSVLPPERPWEQSRLLRPAGRSASVHV